MKTKLNVILTEIYQVTQTIQEKYPQLYQTLNETPIRLDYTRMAIRVEDYRKYLRFLKEQIRVLEHQTHA